ncbi:Phosphoribosylformylglycinamidine synthase, partial [Ophiophagus hannah]
MERLDYEKRKTLPSTQEMEMLQWVFGCPFEEGDIAPKSFLSPCPSDLLVEIGPRLNFSTAYSTNAVSVCLAAGLENIDRVECSRRYLFKCDQLPTSSQETQLVASLYDRMTEQTYPEPIQSFAVATRPEAVFHVDILGEGRPALMKANNQLGLAFDSWDLDFYTALFQKLGRNPTSVECFDLAQSNSEHSRHWFFKGCLLVDGKEMKESLFESIMKTQERSNPNNVIKFCDNSRSCPIQWCHHRDRWENPGCAMHRSRGSRYSLPWEDTSFIYPDNFARPVEVAIGASDGASDYGNKFGEPVLAGDNASELDFGAVQRGDAEMEQKMNRVLRGCVESGENNPICSLHDQGAGGNGEHGRREDFGPRRADFLQRLASRERCAVDFVGKITGNGKIVLVDDTKSPASTAEVNKGDTGERDTPVNLKLEWVLGKMPRKEFVLNRVNRALRPLDLPKALSVVDALQRVLKLPAVASKRYLTNKVDRSVTGLVAQQQCVGPLHTPLADVAVVALSPFETVGGATALGEQPIKGLINPAAGARLAVGEALTNLVFALVTDLKLGVAVDGGKDSLSMAARVGTETVKAPGTLVISAYAVCPDITATVTPDLKCPDGKGALLHVAVNPDKHRLGGSALAQCFSQLGDASPDLDDPSTLVSCFRVTQDLLRDSLLSSGHDVSDGGLLTCLLEMAIAGNCGAHIELGAPGVQALDVLFAEELGLVLEVPRAAAADVCGRYREAGVRCVPVGYSGPRGPNAMVQVTVNGQQVLVEKVSTLRNWWEATSFQLEKLQANPDCVAQEEMGLSKRTEPNFTLTFNPQEELPLLQEMALPAPRVAVLREEGSNGDREMVAAFLMAGFQVWDLTMQDLCSGTMTLDSFRGLVFVGGFSYADVLGSAKGWAASVTFNPRARAQFQAFHQRKDTFSLGVCNGCQLMALLGLLLSPNNSGRFESRFVNLGIEESPALMLRGMAGSTLGIWVAHGEGLPTEEYPLNPNGSPMGIAGVCSPDGRHLAMMPHPERCVLPWQWPWMPTSWRQSVKVSPWLRMFQNACEWCVHYPEGQP